MDETTFTIRTAKSMAYLRPRLHCLHLPDPQQQETIHLVAAVRAEYGIESYKVFSRSMNSERFCEILKAIRRRGQKLVLFSDNASWHVSEYTKYELAKINTSLIRNVPYSPELNPIERFWT